MFVSLNGPHPMEYFGAKPCSSHVWYGPGGCLSQSPCLLMHTSDKITQAHNHSEEIRRIMSAARQNKGFEMNSLLNEEFLKAKRPKQNDFVKYQLQSPHLQTSNGNNCSFKDVQHATDGYSVAKHTPSMWQRIVNCQGFECSKIHVKVLDGVLKVRGVAKQTSDDGREISRSVVISSRIPDYVDTTKLSCKLISKSKLLIEAPTKYINNGKAFSSKPNSMPPVKDEDAGLTTHDILPKDSYPSFISPNNATIDNNDKSYGHRDAMNDCSQNHVTSKEKQEAETCYKKTTYNNLEISPSTIETSAFDMTNHSKHTNGLYKVDTNSDSTNLNREDIEILKDVKTTTAYTVEEPEEKYISGTNSETLRESGCPFVFPTDSELHSDSPSIANEKEVTGEQAMSHDSKTNNSTLNEYNDMDNVCNTSNEHDTKSQIDLDSTALKSDNNAKEEAVFSFDTDDESLPSKFHDFHVQLDMPFCNPESIRVTMNDTDNILNIRAYKESLDSVMPRSLIEKHIPIPDNVDAQQLMCLFRDGILSITAPLKCQN